MADDDPPDFNPYFNRPDDKLVWRTTRLRMARLVEGHGCDAIVDHVFVQMATTHPDDDSQTLALGRSLEREEPAGPRGRVVWRFARVVPDEYALGTEELDGVAVREHSRSWYSHKLDHLSVYTVFRPERVAPSRRQAVGSVKRAASAGAGGLCWFSAALRVFSLRHQHQVLSITDLTYLLRATDFDAAFARALAIGRAKNETFLDSKKKRCRTCFAAVLSINLLSTGDLDDIVEVDTVQMPVRDIDRVPFDTVFHPENFTWEEEDGLF